jgi:general stress protein 26
MGRPFAGSFALNDVFRVRLRRIDLVALDLRGRRLFLYHLAFGLPLAGLPRDFVTIFELVHWSSPTDFGSKRGEQTEVPFSGGRGRGNNHARWTLLPCTSHQETTMSSMTLDELSSHLKKIDFCMFSTNAVSGRISSRPMSNNGDVEYDGDSWFFSYDDTKKIGQIEAIDDVLLTFTAGSSLFGKPGIFIAVEGTATLIRDKASFEKHWVSSLDRWFPDGVETPGIVLIKVSAKSIQYWDGENQGEVPVGMS